MPNMALTPLQREYREKANARWNVKTGATRSGKTWLDVAYVIPKRILAVKGLPGLNVFLGNTKGTLQRNVIEPLQERFGSARVSSIRSDNTAILFGERVHCLGADNKKHVDRLRGSSIKYCYGDEVVTWNQEVFDMLKSRLDKPYSCFDGTCNPNAPGHWFKRFLDSDADIFQQSYTLDDNPFLPPAFVTNLKHEYAGTVYYDRYILGRWVAAEGQIYPGFPACVEDAPPEVFGEVVCSMDYGTRNATAMLLWGLSGGVWHCFREYYYSGRDQQHSLTDDEYLHELMELTCGTGCRRLIIDPSAASFITLVKRKIQISVHLADNDVLDGIRETSTAIKRGLVKVSRSCPNLIREMNAYVWDDKSIEDRPVKVNDHAPDAMRYFVRTMKITRERRALLI